MKTSDFDNERTPLLQCERLNQSQELSWTESWKNLKSWHKAWTYSHLIPKSMIISCTNFGYQLEKPGNAKTSSI